ncbi:peptide MFS transporter [Legionella dresdenensis]|uniref:Peptide MFS transporter n=1 Tax=Legionella dresdenensis TaxID=450200 RepID=A0ABV8CAX4_9GAMM
MHTEDLKQPSSLRVFFATEMWERYGFYVVQTLLALYLALHFKWPDKQVYSLVASFTALTYLSPIMGGWVADQLLGQKNSILAGAVFLFFSYATLALSTSEYNLVVALACIALGTGFLKPNISSLLGNEYAENSPQRESGFTIFYMGITTGIILGTTLPSLINKHLGWSASFASAAVGMIIAFTVFFFGVRKYQIKDYNHFEYRHSKIVKAFFITMAFWIFSFFVLMQPHFADAAFLIASVISLIYLSVAIKRESPAQARQTIVIGLLCIISVLFWAFYFQMFLSLTLFISRVVQPQLFGIAFPPPYYVSIQSLGMLLFGYLLSRSKPTLNLAERGIRTGNKFMLAIIFMFMAYALIAYVCNHNLTEGLLSPLLFIPAYLLISIAELLLSPVGLSAITMLASRRKVSTMMGIFFVSLGVGAFLSGKLAEITSVDPDQLSIVELKVHYANTFLVLFLILFGVTIVCALLNFVIKYLLRYELKA